MQELQINGEHHHDWQNSNVKRRLASTRKRAERFMTASLADVHFINNTTCSNVTHNVAKPSGSDKMRLLFQNMYHHLLLLFQIQSTWLSHLKQQCVVFLPKNDSQNHFYDSLHQARQVSMCHSSCYKPMTKIIIWRQKNYTVLLSFPIVSPFVYLKVLLHILNSFALVYSCVQWQGV